MSITPTPGLTECPECNSPNVTIEGRRLSWCKHHSSYEAPADEAHLQEFVGSVKVTCHKCGHWTFRRSGYEAKKALGEELEGRSAQDGQELLELLPLAARLRAVGGSVRPYRRLIKSADSYQKGFNTLLVERAEEGIHDLDAALGDSLAMSLLEAQDFYIVLCIEYGRSVDPWDETEVTDSPHACNIPMQARQALISWVAKTQEITLELDGARLVRRYTERYPLPKWLRLPAIESPYNAAFMAWVTG